MKIEKIHNFEDSQKIEESGFGRQNKFYKQYFGNLPHRVSYVKYKEIQRSDRDLFIENTKGEVFSISEKNRTEDYDDILFEIYSIYYLDGDYRNKTGWGMDSKADLLAYFLPSSVVLVDMKKMVSILSDPCNKITKQVEMIYRGTMDKDIWFYNKPYHSTIVRAYNKSGYWSLSITLKERILKELGVRHRVFSLP